MIYFYLIIFLFGLSMQMFLRGQKTEYKLEVMRNGTDAAAPQDGGNNTATNALGTNNTGAAGGNQSQGNSSGVEGQNAIGKITPDGVVAAIPYKITKCDQVLEITGEYLVDFTDYAKKAPGFFTLSMYLVNMFKAKDGNTLIESVSLSKLNSEPHIIQGSDRCINFSSKNRKFGMCLNTRANADLILEAFKNLMKCRMGDNLKSTPRSVIRKVFKKSCLGLDVTFDDSQYAGNPEKANAAMDAAITKALKRISDKAKGILPGLENGTNPNSINAATDETDKIKGEIPTKEDGGKGEKAPEAAATPEAVPPKAA